MVVRRQVDRALGCAQCDTTFADPTVRAEAWSIPWGWGEPARLMFLCGYCYRQKLTAFGRMLEGWDVPVFGTPTSHGEIWCTCPYHEYQEPRRMRIVPQIGVHECEACGVGTVEQLIEFVQVRHRAAQSKAYQHMLLRLNIKKEA